MQERLEALETELAAKSVEVKLLAEARAQAGELEFEVEGIREEPRAVQQASGSSTLYTTESRDGAGTGAGVVSRDVAAIEAELEEALKVKAAVEEELKEFSEYTDEVDGQKAVLESELNQLKVRMAEMETLLTEKDKEIKDIRESKEEKEGKVACNEQLEAEILLLRDQVQCKVQEAAAAEEAKTGEHVTAIAAADAAAVAMKELAKLREVSERREAEMVAQEIWATEAQAKAEALADEVTVLRKTLAEKTQEIVSISEAAAGTKSAAYEVTDASTPEEVEAVPTPSVQQRVGQLEDLLAEREAEANSLRELKANAEATVVKVKTQAEERLGVLEKELVGVKGGEVEAAEEAAMRAQELLKLKGQVTELRECLAQASQDHNAQRDELEAAKLTAEQALGETAKAAQMISSLESKVLELTESLGEAHGTRDAMKEEFERARDIDKGEAADEISTLQAHVEELKGSLQEVRQASEAVQAKKDEVETAYNEAFAMAANEQAQVISELNMKVAELMKSADETCQSRDALQAELQGVRDGKEEAAARASAKHSEVTSGLENQVALLQESLEEARKVHERCAAGAEEDLKAATTLLTDTKESLRKVEDELSASNQSQIELRCLLEEKSQLVDKLQDELNTARLAREEEREREAEVFSSRLAEVQDAAQRALRSAEEEGNARISELTACLSGHNKATEDLRHELMAVRAEREELVAERNATVATHAAVTAAAATVARGR
ncbi:unnamed protein product, partial [Discosporangium mesarthrocarpum]